MSLQKKMQTISVLMAKLEAMKRKSFTQWLAGPTLLWFHQLSSRSIDCDNKLIRKFIGNFSINVKVSKAPDDLVTIK